MKQKYKVWAVVDRKTGKILDQVFVDKYIAVVFQRSIYPKSSIAKVVPATLIIEK